jgi:hypothetical protein
MHYVIQRAASRPAMTADWDDPAWTRAAVMSVNSFHPLTGGHRPHTEARLMYDDGKLEAPAHRSWCGNLFKCADESSNPHWASWNPIGEELNFHDPRYFASIRFARSTFSLGCPSL